MSDADLLPCPFCGSAAASPYFNDREDSERGEVYCTKCSANTQGSHQGWMCDEADKLKSISEAITAWNTRTALPQEASQ